MRNLTITLAGFIALLVLTGAVQVNVASADQGIVLREIVRASESYCHIQYMAYKPFSLLTSEREFDPDHLVDYYGPCSFDPRSEHEVMRQLADANWSLSADDDSGE